MPAAATLPTFIPLFIAIAIRRAERRIYRQLADAGAFSEESAIQLSPGRSLERKRLQSLIRGGAVRPGRNDCHYLDIEGWDKYQRNRGRRALLVMSVLLTLAGIAFGVLYLVRWRS